MSGESGFGDERQDPFKTLTEKEKVEKEEFAKLIQNSVVVGMQTTMQGFLTQLTAQLGHYRIQSHHEDEAETSNPKGKEISTHGSNKQRSSRLWQPPMPMFIRPQAIEEADIAVGSEEKAELWAYFEAMPKGFKETVGFDGFMKYKGKEPMSKSYEGDLQYKVGKS